MRKIGVVCLVCTMSTMALFEYDRALQYAQKGDWQQAVTLLRTLITDRPNDTQLLYDTGVASYNNEEYVFAQAYFSEAITASTKQDPLHEQALFNRGNAHVQLNQLHKALADYEAVLKINPDNEKARANRDLVRKMLEEQERQKQESEQNSDTQDDSESAQECNDNGKSGEQEPDESTQQDESEEQESGESDDSQESNTQENNEKESDYDSQWNSDERHEQDAEQSPSEEPKGGHDTQEQDSSYAPEKTNPYEGLEDWVSAVLEDRDKKDSELNKQMIKATVHNQAENHEHCW